MDIKKKLNNIPNSPGVYLFFGRKRETLYIGKASNLRKRVSSYFQKKRLNLRMSSMVPQIEDIDYIETKTSAEALIYEAGLIKEKKPKYNVELKDDKSYPFLKLTVKEKYPRLFIYRGKPDDDSIYYGPYTDVKLLKKSLAVIRNIFRMRSCRNLPKKACLKAYIRGCVAPCDGSISEAEYRKIVDEVKLFLEGKREALIDRLSRQMREASEKTNYEKAISLRDKIEALSAMWKGRKPPPPLQRETVELKKVLGLDLLPVRIEAFDISNIHGAAPVGSMVSFFNGKPQKDEYRRFRIKGVSGIDDYAMTREVIRRRYERVLKEKKPLPDVILIDGGKGHLNAVKRELDNIKGLPKMNVICIAKGEERVYAENKKRPLRIPASSPALKLIMRIRDETHRFAISYHKFLRAKDALHSFLDDIEGIGEKRKKAIISCFGSVERLKDATLESVMQIKGIDEKTARKILEYFSAYKKNRNTAYAK
ncbi:MAG: excinuclease ABC subunit UvrC [Candidatus Omnitrophica bacterium]|nr:excinuclease ABC subunit UvrC [Candidatus Omnitrophota bacterium]